MEEEEELGPDAAAAAAAEPLAAPCALRGGGGGGAGPPARAPSRRPGLSRCSPKPAGLPGGRDARRAGQREAAGLATAEPGPRAAQPAGAATRQTEREPAPAPIRALGNPLARLPRFPPRAPLDSAELAPVSPRLEPEWRGSANRCASTRTPAVGFPEHGSWGLGIGVRVGGPPQSWASCWDPPGRSSRLLVATRGGNVGGRRL